MAPVAALHCCLSVIPGSSVSELRFTPPTTAKVISAGIQGVDIEDCLDKSSAFDFVQKTEPLDNTLQHQPSRIQKHFVW